LVRENRGNYGGMVELVDTPDLEDFLYVLPKI